MPSRVAHGHALASHPPLPRSRLRTFAQEYDVLIYGATPGGIAAALAAAEDGEKVLLVEPTARIGGMVTNGLSHPDFRTFEGLTGAFLKFTQARRGALPRDLRRGFAAGEGLAARHAGGAEGRRCAIFEKMLAAQPRITVQREWALDAGEIEQRSRRRRAAARCARWRSRSSPIRRTSYHSVGGARFHRRHLRRRSHGRGRRAVSRGPRGRRGIRRSRSRRTTRTRSSRPTISASA